MAVVIAAATLGDALVPTEPKAPAPSWILRVVLGVAALTLLFVVEVSGLPWGFGLPVALLLLVSGSVIVVRLARRARVTTRPSARPEDEAGSSTSGLTDEVVLDDGRTFAARGRLLVGRVSLTSAGDDLRPDQQDDVDLVLIEVDDGSQTISRRHALLDFTASRVVIDQGSSSGTAVTSPDGRVEQCQPGVEVPLLPGDVVSFGDRSLVLRASNGSAPASGSVEKDVL